MKRNQPLQFLTVLEQEKLSPKDILCAYIELEVYEYDEYGTCSKVKYILKENYSQQELSMFLKNLESTGNSDIVHSIYAKDLDSFIWLKDGSWLFHEEWGEYNVDGWKRNVVPKLPEVCRNKLSLLDKIKRFLYEST